MRGVHNILRKERSFAFFFPDPGWRFKIVWAPFVILYAILGASCRHQNQITWIHRAWCSTSPSVYRAVLFWRGGSSWNFWILLLLHLSICHKIVWNVWGWGSWLGTSSTTPMKSHNWFVHHITFPTKRGHVIVALHNMPVTAWHLTWTHKGETISTTVKC